MAEWKVQRGFLDSHESGDASAQPQATSARDVAGSGAEPRFEDDPLVELARIVSESAANLGRLGAQPGDEPTLILGRATPKPLPLRPENPAGGFVSRATPTLSPSPPAAPFRPAAPPVEPPTRGANPLTFEDDLLAELRQSVDTRVGQPRPAPAPAPDSGRPAAPAADSGRLAALRAAPHLTGDEPTARVAQVVQSAMTAGERPPVAAGDDDDGPTIALNLRGGPRAVPVPPAAAPAARSPLEDGFDDLFADTAAERPKPAATAEPRLTAGQPAGRDAPAARPGDNFPRPAVEPPTARGAAAARSKTGAKTRPVRPQAQRSAVGTGLFAAGSLLAVVVLAGLGYLGYRAYATNVAATDGVPVIKAVGKLKEETPARPATADSGTPRLAADTVEDKTKLVTKSEEPVDQIAVGPRRIVPGAPGTLVPLPAGDQPRTVKTVVVRPDGTVTQQSTPAPAPTPVRVQPIVPTEPAPLVAAAPTPPATPTPVPARPDPIGQHIAPAPAAAAAPAAPVTAAPPPAPTKPATTTATPAPRLAPQPAAPAGAPLALAPQTQPLPPAPIAGQVQPRLAAAPPPAAVTPAPTAAASGDYMVQLSSQRSEAEAQRSFAQLQGRFPVLSGKALDVQRADLGTRGTYYRVRVAGGSQEQAASLCGQIKTAGGDCVVTKR